MSSSQESAEQSQTKRKSNKSQMSSTANHSAVQGDIFASSPTTASKNNRGTFKKFMMKVGEKVGTVDRTEYPQELVEQFTDLDMYQVVLEDLATNICKTYQQTPGIVTDPLKRMYFEYAEGKAPMEMVETTLKEGLEKNCFPKVTVVKNQAKLANELGATHHDYQKKARKAIHEIRSFLNCNIEPLCVERKKLNALRQEMDFARHELKNANTVDNQSIRKIVYEECLKVYDTQLALVTKLFSEVPANKLEHAEDVQSFMVAYKKYHQENLKLMKAGKFK